MRQRWDGGKDPWQLEGLLVKYKPIVARYISDHKLVQRARKEGWLSNRDCYKLKIAWKYGSSSTAFVSRVGEGCIHISRWLEGTELLTFTLCHELVHIMLVVDERVNAISSMTENQQEYEQQPHEQMADEVAYAITGVSRKEYNAYAIEHGYQEAQ